MFQVIMYYFINHGSHFTTRITVYMTSPRWQKMSALTLDIYQVQQVQTRHYFTNIFSTIYIGCYSCPNFGILQLNSSTSGLYIMKRPCSHVASMIWFLAYARHNKYKSKKDNKSPLLMYAAEGHLTYIHDRNTL